jgi:uncharacterized protein
MTGTAPRPHHGHGIDLRPEHYQSLLEAPLEMDWVEVISERFLGTRGGIRLDVLERVRREVPVSLHGTTMSVGSVDPLDRDYLGALKALADRIEPVWVSDHLAWSSFGGADLDLFPLPYTEESLDHVVARVVAIQEALGRTFLLENPSSYVAFRSSAIPECDFLAAVAQRADCGILLDVNNVYVSARNLGFDPGEYLSAIPPDRVHEIHLAGHRDLGGLLADTHEGPVPSAVWELYREAVRRFGPVPTIVEWDTAVPELDTMVAESRRAALIEKEVCGEAGGTPAEVRLAGHG